MARSETDMEYCQRMAQEICVEDELARRTYARERRQRGDASNGPNEYLQALDQGDEACHRLRERDRKFDRALQSKLAL